MYIKCPECKYVSELDSDDLPNNACDDKEFECHDCEATFNIGWYATAELR